MSGLDGVGFGKSWESIVLDVFSIFGFFIYRRRVTVVVLFCDLMRYSNVIVW